MSLQESPGVNTTLPALPESTSHAILWWDLKYITSINKDGQTDGRTHRRTDGWKHGWIDAWIVSA